MSKIDELEKLNRLRREGAISEEEYQRLKDEAMNGPKDWAESLSQATSQINEDQWAMFLHFSQLLNFVMPFAGLVVPVVLWQLKKKESVLIDQHGKVVVNWLLSAFIYALVCVPLVFIIIGYLGLAILAVVGVIFPVVGGIEAHKGRLWPYPFSISFFK